MRKGEGGKDLDGATEETVNPHAWTADLEVEFAVPPVYCLLVSLKAHSCSDTFRKFTNFNLMLP